MLTRQVLSESLTEIHDSVFENCKSLESINIPDSVTTIDSKAFLNCTHLRTISLFDDNYQELASCEDGAFTFPQTLKTTDNDSYNNSNNMTFQNVGVEKVKVGANTRTIGSYAFANNANLESVEFDDNSILKSVGTNAFENDTKLTTISFPSTLTTLGSSAFSGCENLVSIDFANTQVRTIGANLFADCVSLTHVDLPSTVSSIRSGAFSGAKALDYVIIPDAITQINSNAFINNRDDGDTDLLPIYFEKTLAEAKQKNIADDFHDEHSYASYRLEIGETKLAGYSYWDGNSASPTEIVLSALAYEGTLNKTAYKAGDAFDPTGLTITASYSDSADLVLSGIKDIVWEQLTSGDTSVTGSYTVGKVTKTITISGITVA